MVVERDAMTERLARLGNQLAEVRRTKAQIAPQDRSAARQLADQLDAMLKELEGPNQAKGRSR